MLLVLSAACTPLPPAEILRRAIENPPDVPTAPLPEPRVVGFPTLAVLPMRAITEADRPLAEVLDTALADQVRALVTDDTSLITPDDIRTSQLPYTRADFHACAGDCVLELANAVKVAAAIASALDRTDSGYTLSTRWVTAPGGSVFGQQTGELGNEIEALHIHMRGVSTTLITEVADL